MKIITDRLVICPVHSENVEDIYKNFKKEITTYMYPSPSNSIEEVESLVDMFVKNKLSGEEYVYAIIHDKEFIGLCGLHNLKSEIPELGIWLKIEAHGNYFGREAIAALITYAAELGYKNLLYPVDRRNIASKKIPLFFLAKGPVKSYEKITSDGRVLEMEDYIISTDSVM